MGGIAESCFKLNGPSATERHLGTIHEEKGISSWFQVLSCCNITLAVESDVKSHSFLLLGLKKSCLFPVTLPLQVFIQKNPYPKVFISLSTPNQRKTCINHTFLTKKIMKKKIFLPIYLPYFFQTVTGNKQFIFLRLTFSDAHISARFGLSNLCSVNHM